MPWNRIAVNLCGLLRNSLIFGTRGRAVVSAETTGGCAQAVPDTMAAMINKCFMCIYNALTFVLVDGFGNVAKHYCFGYSSV